MWEFLINHPAFSVTLFGCFLGTLMTYVAPRFTRDYLVADEWFCAGNLGIASFIHSNWSHFIGNMILGLPAVLFCENYFGDKFTLIFILVYSFIEGMMTLVVKQCWCGFSGQACALFMMMCSYGMHWWGIAAAVSFVVAELSVTIGDTSRSSHLVHFIGMGLGFGLGYFMQTTVL